MKTLQAWLDNRPLPSSKNPHFQNEASCSTFLVKMSFICMRMKNDLHIKGWAPKLVLKQRLGWTRKWPILKPVLDCASQKWMVQGGLGYSLWWPITHVQCCVMCEASRNLTSFTLPLNRAPDAFLFSSQLKIWSFHVVVVQGRQRNVQKSEMHVQSFYFAKKNLLCLNVPVADSGNGEEDVLEK